VKRRDFIALIVGAAAVPALWPLSLRAQQRAMPVVGLLSAVSPGPTAHLIAAIRQGLTDAGFVEGRNIRIEYRWAEGQYDRLPALAAELVRRQVDVIVASPSVSAVAAKAATATIPIVFGGTDDPVKLGLVANLARPGGNATGVHFFLSALAAKQLGLLRELVPTAARIGLLVNPNNANVENVTREVTTAASSIAVQIEVVSASDRSGIEAAFTTLVRNKADALVVAADPFFFSRRLQLATLATRSGIPAVYNVREFAEVGGLMTYGTNLLEVFRQVGNYTARILKGDRPADLPVMQSTKFEFIINLPTARALGLTVPPTLLARADEVIE
jgi:putative ABC transport system substrate-binding protein